MTFEEYYNGLEPHQKAMISPMMAYYAGKRDQREMDEEISIGHVCVKSWGLCPCASEIAKEIRAQEGGK